MPYGYDYRMYGFNLLYSYVKDGQEATLLDLSNSNNPIKYPITLHITPYGIRIKYDRTTQFQGSELRVERLKITLNSFIVDQWDNKTVYLQHFIPTILTDYNEDGTVRLLLQDNFAIKVQLQYSVKPLQDIHSFIEDSETARSKAYNYFLDCMDKYQKDFPEFFRKPSIVCKGFPLRTTICREFPLEAEQKTTTIGAVPFILQEVTKFSNPFGGYYKVPLFCKANSHNRTHVNEIPFKSLFFGVNDKDEIILQASILDDGNIYYCPNLLDFSVIENQYTSNNLPFPFSSKLEV